MFTNESIASACGPQWSARYLLGHDPASLRFELGKGRMAHKRIITAFATASLILESLLGDADVTLASISIWTDVPSGDPVSLLLGDLSRLEIVPAEYMVVTHDDGDDSGRILLVFASTKDQRARLLRAAVSLDFPTMATATVADLRIISLELGVVASIYDDRGMDIGGKNRPLLPQLAIEHRSHLLEYDIEEMTRRYPEILQP